MNEFLGKAYRGPPLVPHTSTAAFGTLFVGTHTAIVAMRTQGHWGSELRPRKYSRDYVLAMCDSARSMREARSGKPVRSLYMGAPDADAWNFEAKWWNHLHYRRWILDRTGPGYTWK